MDDGEAVSLGAKIIVLFIGIGTMLWGVGKFASANYTNPVQGVQDSLSGALATGVGITMVLVLLGAAGVVAAVLGFILKLISRN